MTELKKITEGMANGCAAIDENFNALNENSKSDIPWTDISPINGFSLTPSTGAKGVLKYKIKQGVLYISARGVVLPDLPLQSPKAFVELPFAVPQNATAAFIGPNLSSSLYAKEVCTLQSNGGDGFINYAKNTATTAGDRFSGMFIVPME
nr:MAG TPA: receptor binding protein [Caudoviricetes sp.]